MPLTQNLIDNMGSKSDESLNIAILIFHDKEQPNLDEIQWESLIFSSICQSTLAYVG